MSETVAGSSVAWSWVDNSTESRPVAEVDVTKWAGDGEDQRKEFHEQEVKQQNNSSRG